MATPLQCECPQVWSGHGDVHHDPTRPDPDCPWHGEGAAYLSIEDHDSIVLITPVGREAVDWIERTAPEDAQWWGRSLVVEPRYVQDVLNVWENR